MCTIHLVFVRSHLTRAFVVVVVDDSVLFLLDTAYCSDNQTWSNTDVHHEPIRAFVMSDYTRIVSFNFLLHQSIGLLATSYNRNGLLLKFSLQCVSKAVRKLCTRVAQSLITLFNRVFDVNTVQTR